MVEQIQEARQAVAAGFAALRRADWTAALEAFSQAAATAQGGASAWYGLSLVHRQMGAQAEESAALMRALSLDSRHLPALIALGDWHARNGDLRAAVTCYQAALRASASHQNLSAEARADLERIHASCERFAREYEEHVRAAVSRAELGTPATGRFSQALDLLLGKRQIHLQQPTQFYFPELPAAQFHDRGRFAWAPALERETAAIRGELQELLRGGTGFEPYLKAGRASLDGRTSVSNPDWSAGYLVRNGVEERQNAARCATTLASLRDVPLCRIDGCTPSVLFSLLRPGAHIAPRHGRTNARLTCHLPLIVPGNCTLRVGNETRSWREGELAVFDDSFEHEASNGSAELHAILVFDVWHPDLSANERNLISVLITSAAAFGPKGQWTD